MVDDKNFLNDDDFEKLLTDFINSDSDKEKPDSESDNSAEKKRETEKQVAAIITDDLVETPKEEKSEEDYIPDFDEVQEVLSQAKADYDEQENQPMLGTDESELAQAFVNFSSSVNNLCVARLKKEFTPKFKIE